MTAGLFRRVSLRRMRRHRLRAALTVLGVALGVAALVSIRLLHTSVSRAYAATIDRIAGRAALQVTNGEAGVPEELVDAVKQLPGVKVAAPSVQGFLPLADGGGQLYVLGIDVLADDALRTYGSTGDVVDDPLMFVTQADSVGLSTAFLRETGRAVGDRVRVRSPSGTVALTVRGELRDTGGPAAAFGGRLAVMDILAAQRLFRLEGRFTEIDVVVPDGVPVPTVQHALERVVAGRGVVERPQQRGEVLERLIATNRYAMTVSAALAIVIGGYLVFNMMMIGVAERRRDFALLGMIGVQRLEVVRLVGLEALLAGALGSALGIPLGLWMATSGAADFAAGLSERFVHVDAPAVTLDPWSVLLGLVLGCGSAVIAAVAPAAAAMRLPPLATLRDATVPPPAPGAARPMVAALVLAMAAAGLWHLRAAVALDRNVTGSLATLGLLAALALAAAPCVRRLARLAERPLTAALGTIGALASRSLVGQEARVGRTSATFLVSLAGALAIATMIASLTRTLSLWFGDVFGQMDLMVTSGERKVSFDAMPFPEAVAGEIRSLPGVRDVEARRFVKVAYDGAYVVIAATDAGEHVHLVEGNAASAVTAVERGEALLVNEPFAREHEKRIGDPVTLASPEGPLTLPIAGIYFDFQDLGEVRMNRRLYRRLWRDATISAVSVGLAPGADRAAAIDAIRRRWGDDLGLFVLTTDEFRAEFGRLLAASTAGASALVVIAIGIALLGLVNALAASVLDRTRELGLLRAAGATRRQIVELVVLEAAIIGGMAGLLGAAAGALLGRMQLDVIVQGMLEMTVVYDFPTRATVVALAGSGLLAAAAGWLPGRRASRLGVGEALGWE
jgi:putative ABC transport system permease protein